MFKKKGKINKLLVRTKSGMNLTVCTAAIWTETDLEKIWKGTCFNWTGTETGVCGSILISEIESVRFVGRF